jgi:heptosyltransferase-2
VLNQNHLKTINKILIIGPSWVGDMIMAQSLFIVLKQDNPNVQIDVMAPTWSSALLERMPEVTDIIDMPLGHGQLQLKERYQLGKSLRNHDYNQVILLPNSLKSALVPFWAKIPKRTGYIGEMRYGLLNDIHSLDKNQLTMTVQRFVALAYSRDTILDDKQIKLANIPFPNLVVKRANIEYAVSKFYLNLPFKFSNKKEKNKPILSLCPGAEYGPAKQWPAKHYAALAKKKLEQGWQVWIFGSQKDRDFATEINHFLDQKAVNLCAKTDLSEAIDLMSLSSAVVSNDSGLMHMGAALGVPIVGIYGSSDPTFTPPLGKHTTVQSLNLDCSPCFKRTCPLGHTDCLENLLPEQVAISLDSLLEQCKQSTNKQTTRDKEA